MQLLLKIEEAGVGLEVWIAFCHRQYASNCPREIALVLCNLGNTLPGVSAGS